MRSIISEEGKLREGRGTGTGAAYKPWIKIRELNSSGTATSFPDWKHGRMVELLSQAELWWYVKLRWDDEVEDIREQFPLDIDSTTSIARKFGFRPVQNGRRHMTTDFLVTWKDGTHSAFSVKTDRQGVLSDRRTVEIQAIEYEYWKERGVRWAILYKEDLNPVEIFNIIDVIHIYRMETVHDAFSYARHLIATKRISVDMDREIDYPQLIEALKKEGFSWKN